MPTAYTEYRAIMLDRRLRRSVDTPYAYTDVTGLQVFPTDDGIDVKVTYSDGTDSFHAFDHAHGAYDMADEVRAEVDRRCAEIRKARNNDQPNN